VVANGTKPKRPGKIVGAGTLKKELSDKFNTMDEEQEMVK